MKTIYNWAVGFFVFFFLAYLFGSLLDYSKWDNFDGIFVTACLFGVVVAAMPAVLGFFKIRESIGALLLVGLVVNFIFYFLGYYVFGLFKLAEQGRIIFGHSSLYIDVEDKVLGLILISLISSAIIVGLQYLKKN